MELQEIIKIYQELLEENGYFTKLYNSKLK